MRIVSLLPAATEIVAALGSAKSLVGVTHECDWPPEVRALPRVTASAGTEGSGAPDDQLLAFARACAPVFALDTAKIKELEPDLILAQAHSDASPVSDSALRALAAEIATPPRIVTLNGKSLKGVLEDIQLVGEALGSKNARSLTKVLTESRRVVHEHLKATQTHRPRVAVIEWINPLHVAGRWVPEMMHAAGGVDALATVGQKSPMVTIDEVRAGTPDIIIIAPCGCDARRAELEAMDLLAKPEWEWASTCAVWSVDAHAYFSRPGPRLWDGIQLIAEILHPPLFQAPRTTDARRLR